jgi:PhoPQ-activated pathogenicity-related protein
MTKLLSPSCVLLAAVLGFWAGFAAATPLDDYIRRPDSNYSWSVVRTYDEGDATVYIVDLQSQMWRSAAEVDRPLWRHWLTVIKPKELAGSRALLIIAGGRYPSPPPDKANPDYLGIARRTHSVVAELKGVPNEPLTFLNDGHPRVEDDAIAYTWQKVMQTKDETWNIRFPMVKSAVRAMDTVTALLKTPEGGGVGVDAFVVTGASKRGWTTWLTGAVDARVIGVIPQVIDVLNVRKSMLHHHEVYGTWADSLHDYVDHGIVDKLDTAEFAALMAYEDPFSYRGRLTVPKLVINASGDEYFLPDSPSLYWSALKDPKYLRVLPNTDHSRKDSNALPNTESFYESVISGRPLPKFTWSTRADGAIVLRTQTAPKEVLLWHAHNPAARDFRLETFGKHFVSTPLTASPDGSYVALPPDDVGGYSAYFIELTYEVPGRSLPLQFTTEVEVRKAKGARP